MVVAPEDVAAFLALADSENLSGDPGRARDRRAASRHELAAASRIVDVSREFLNSNGAPKHITDRNGKPRGVGAQGERQLPRGRTLRSPHDLNICSKQGLSEQL